MNKELVDAAAGLAAMHNEALTTDQNLGSANLHLSVLQETKRNLEGQVHSLNGEVSTLRERILNTQRELQQAREEVIQLKKEDEFRQQKYSEEIASLQEIKHQLLEERAKEVQQRHEEEIARLVE